MNNMKSLFIIAIMTAFAVTSFGANDNKITPSEIKSVKIYTKGAVVTRKATITADAGASTIEFDNLSSSIDKQSVTVTGTGDVTILSVQYNLNYLNEEQKPREVIVLEDSVKFINHELDKLNNLDSVYVEEKSMILSNKSIRDEREGVTADKLTDVANFYRSRLSDISAKLLDIRYEQERLRKDKSRINAQLKTIKTNRDKPTGTINVSLSANTRTQVTLEISYLVLDAGWSPLYDIRAKDISSPIQLNYKANVFQNSGEDWKNIHITLSTGNPTLSGEMPQLYPWHLNFYVPTYQPKYKNRAYHEDVKTLAGKEEADSAALVIRGARSESTKYVVDGIAVTGYNKDEAKLQAIEVNTNNNQLSVDFDIAIPYSVPSDNKVYLVDVQHYEMKADYSYHAIPKLDKDAFLIARVTGWEAMNLLSGNANIFFENAFIGASYLQLNNASDTLDISLGRDKKISINREKQKDFTKSQTVGSNIVKTIAYEISVRNSKAEAINITLDDQLPISDNKDISVKMLENSNAEFNDKTGTMTWKMNVAPSATEKRKLSFSVKYPKDQNVPNL